MSALAAAIDAAEPDFVVHLAARAGGGRASQIRSRTSK
jgi:hypothetical protein